MSQLRLVILDYAKNQLDNPYVKKIFSDLIFARQKNYERTDQDYISTDKHDMIGTHIIIYDTSDFLAPKIIFAIRVTYEERARQHHISTPLQDLLPHLNADFQAAVEKYRVRHGSLTESGALFVDQGYSFSKTKTKLSDIGFTAIGLHLQRFGCENLIGFTNERYKASRLLLDVGQFETGYTFTHPVIKDPHMLIMINQFNKKFFKDTYEKNKELFNSAVELIPNHSNNERISMLIDKLLPTKDQAA